jgi:Uma2 family endonuclease
LKITLATQPITLQEFLRSPNIEESPAWEFFDQGTAQKPMPTLYCSRLQKRLVAAIDNCGSIYEAFPELRCNLSQNSVVPDITVVERTRIPAANQAISGAPNWIIEILSPDQRMTRVVTKIQACLEQGMQLGWLIDVEEQAVLVFCPDRPLSIVRNQAILPVLPDMALALTAQQVFAWAQ